MTVLDGLATEVQYLDHLLPVWLALPRDTRRHLYVPRALAPRALAAGVGGDEVRTGRPAPRSADPLLVASFKDLRAGRSRPVILMEHGVGQGYSGIDHGSYAGGPGRGNVVLFLCPTADVAARNRARYPQTPAVVVGVPRLDVYRDRPFFMNIPPTVAVTFHWNGDLVSEMGSAFGHYRDVLPRLFDHPRFYGLGHAHPRARDVQAEWKRFGVPYEPDSARVLDEASCLVVDNSSMIYEFAALDRPVVVLDCPAYRRDVEHGLRFWRHADVGVRIGDPARLVEAVERALEDTADVAARRREVVAEVFGGMIDGQASTRAADAILTVLADLRPRRVVRDVGAGVR